MHGQHITLEGDRATSEPAIVAHIDASSATPVAPTPDELTAEVRKLAVDYVRRLGWQL